MEREERGFERKERGNREERERKERGKREEREEREAATREGGGGQRNEVWRKRHSEEVEKDRHIEKRERERERDREAERKA